MRGSGLWVFAGFLLLGACQPEKEPVFESVAPSFSGVQFSNELTPSEAFNIVEYLYYYNGGGVAVGDINRDSLPDLFFTANQQANKLYLNKGGFQFEDITDQAGILDQQDWSTGVSMADVNGDGQLDIYVCGVSGYKGLEGRNELYINQGNGTFKEEAAAYGLDIAGFSQQAAFFDYDLDGDLDLYLLKHSVHTPENYGPSSIREKRDSLAGDHLYRNDGTRFTDVSELAGIYSSRIGFGLGIAIGDLDNNGCPDIYIGNDFHENDYLYYNNCDGTFKEGLTDKIAHTSRFSMGVDLADVNNDQLVDITSLDMKPADEIERKSMKGDDPANIYDFKIGFGYNHQYARNALQINQGNHFSELAQFAGISATDWSWSGLWMDADNDGNKDLFVTNGIWQRPTDLDYLNYIANENVQAEASNLELANKMPEGLVANVLYHNQGNLQFEEVGEEWGLGLVGSSQGAAYADLDRDGDLDLVVNNLNMTASIYQNHGQGNYLQIRPIGPAGNPFGIGLKATLWIQGTAQVLELFPAKGWQSSVEPMLHFGLGAATKADSLVVIWPDGKQQVWEAMEANQVIYPQYEEAALVPTSKSHTNTTLLDACSLEGLNYVHVENTYNDFDYTKLIPHKLSTEGPALAVGDVNGDGLDDLFLGGSHGHPAEIYVQQPDGSFQPTESKVLQSSKGLEDVDAAFFDADNDGDQDLIVVRGGNEFSDGSMMLVDQLYFNDGIGVWRLSREALPAIQMQAGCVEPLDYNQDGYMDLFIGTHFRYQAYGVPASGFLLENDGTGNFSDVTDAVVPELRKVGLITDALWRPDQKELVVVGEWMPILRIRFSNDGKAKYKELDYVGWWNCVAEAENGIVIGNLGSNTALNAPLGLYIDDFDGNGSIDPIMTYERNGVEYPFFGKDELVSQIVEIKKRFVRYEGFANSSIEEVMGKAALYDAYHLEANFLASAFLPDNSEQPIPLPDVAQWAPMMDFLSVDLDQDGRLELIGGGNFYGCQPEIGRLDASSGVVLDESMQFLESKVHGFQVTGEARKIALLKGAEGKRYILVARNNGPISVFCFN